MINVIRAKKIFSEETPNSYLIPNRKIVSYLLIEAQHNLIEGFGDLTQNPISPNKLKSCYDKAVVLYFYIKQYRKILAKIKNWDTFEKEFTKFIKDPTPKVTYENIHTSVDWLTKAVYTLGITQIETEKRDMNNIYRP